MSRQEFTDLGHVFDALAELERVHDQGDAMHTQAVAQAAERTSRAAVDAWGEAGIDG